MNSLIKVNNVFRRNEDREIRQIPISGMSVQEVLDKYFPNQEYGISINGEVIDPKYYKTRIITEEDQLVGVPHVYGLDRDGKVVLNIALTVAVAILAPYAAPGVASATGLSTQAAAGLLMAVGGILIATLSPIPPEPINNAIAESTRETYGFDPKTTQTQGIPIPRFYGTNKIYGNIISAFTQIDNNSDESTINMLIALGAGPMGELSELKINEQPIENFGTVTHEYRNGILNQQPFDDFTLTKSEFTAGLNIFYDQPVIYLTDGLTFDSLDFDINFPAGIYFINSTGDPKFYMVKIKGEIKGELEENYRPLFIGNEWSIHNITVDVNNKPVITIRGVRPRINAGEFIIIENVEGLTNANTVNKDTGYYVVEKGWKTVRPDIEVNVRNNHLLTTAHYDFHIRLNFDASSWDENDYVSKTGTCRPNVVTIYEKRIGSFTRQFNVSNDRLVQGQRHQIKLTRLTKDQLNKNGQPKQAYGDLARLTVVREAVNEVFTYPKTAVIGIKGVATRQLSGRFDFSCLAECLYAETYTHNSDNGYGVEISKNPAWVLYNILSQPVFSGSKGFAAGQKDSTVDPFVVERYDGINPTRLDLDMFIELANFCKDLVYNSKPRITFNGGFDGESTIWESVLDVCRVARCIPLWNGSKITLAIDKAADPVQLFTVSNTKEGSFSENFLPIADRATTIEINHLDAGNDYKRNTFSIVDPNTTVRANRVTLDLFGITNTDEAWRAGVRHLNQNNLVLRSIQFEADIDSLACIVGDIITFQNDIPDWGDGGRIIGFQSPNVITLDKNVSIPIEQTPQITYRVADHPLDVGVAGDPKYTDRLITKTINTISDNVITVSGILNEPEIPGIDDVYAVSSTQVNTKKFRVAQIARASDQTVTILATEYIDSLYTSDDEEPKIIDAPAITLPDIRVTSLSASEIAFIDATDSVIKRQIQVNYTIPRDALWAKAIIYYKSVDETSWIIAGETTSDKFNIADILSNTAYDIRVVSLDHFGRQTDLALAPEVTVVTGDIPDSLGDTLDERVSGLKIKGETDPFVITFTGPHVSFQWNAVQSISRVGETDVLAQGSAGSIQVNDWLRDYEVVIKDADTGVVRRTEYVHIPEYTYTYSKNVQDGVKRKFKIEVRARDIFFRKSVLPAHLTVSNPGPTVPENITALSFTLSYRLSWDAAEDNDLLGYIVWADSSSGFSLTDDKIIYKGTNNSLNYSVSSTQAVYFRIAAYDQFGLDQLNVSDEYSVTPTDVTPGVLSSYDWDRPQLEGIGFTISGETISWTSGNIAYKGQSYSIAAGSTTDVFIYFDFLEDPIPSTFKTIGAFTNNDPSDPIKWNALQRPPLAHTDSSDTWLLAWKRGANQMATEVIGDFFTAALMQVDAITGRELAFNSVNATHIEAQSLVIGLFAQSAIDDLQGQTGPAGPAGQDGADGANGSNGADGLDVNWRGNYSGVTTYSLNDAVLYNGSAYIYINVSPSSGSLPTNTSFWNLMASKGDTGDTGPAGQDGVGVATFRQATAPTFPPAKDDDVWFDTSGATGVLPKRAESSAWVDMPIKTTAIAAGTVAANVVIGNTANFVTGIIRDVIALDLAAADGTINNLVVQTAHIQDLAVDTAKIAGSAVHNNVLDQKTSLVFAARSYSVANTVTLNLVDNSAKVKVEVSAYISNSASTTNYNFDFQVSSIQSTLGTHTGVTLTNNANNDITLDGALYSSLSESTDLVFFTGGGVGQPKAAEFTKRGGNVIRIANSWVSSQEAGSGITLTFKRLGTVFSGTDTKWSEKIFQDGGQYVTAIFADASDGASTIEIVFLARNTQSAASTFVTNINNSMLYAEEIKR